MTDPLLTGMGGAIIIVLFAIFVQLTHIKYDIRDGKK